MNQIVDKIPSIIVLSSLVGLFLALYRKHRTLRVRFWAFGWGLILLHYVLRTYGSVTGHLPFLLIAVDLVALQVAGVAFLISTSRIAERRRTRLVLLTVLALGSVLAGISAAMQPHSALMMVVGTSLALFGGLAFFVWWNRQVDPYVVSISVGMILSGGWAMYQVLHGRVMIGLLANLFWAYLFAGVLFVRRYLRWSPGVITTCLGFFGWASIWALAALAPKVIGALPDYSELWNVPKYIVGIGMIVVLLEDQLLLQQSLRHREQLIHHQMEHFSEVTSRLLHGAEVNSLCGYIAEAITHVTTFRRAAVLLTNPEGRLFVGGHYGISPEVLAQLEPKIQKIGPEVITRITQSGRQFGRNSFICAQDEMEQYGAVATRQEYPDNPHWRGGDELIVLLRSPRGDVVGCLSLDEPADVSRVVPEEMCKLELLANDLAAAIERNKLQRELVRSEKLAGVGQLVAGVAHELNNPLTAVLGYAEMLADNAPESNLRQQAATIQREALRMKRIIEDLLRFCRHGKSGRHSVAVSSALEDVLRLCSYQLKHRNIEVQVDVPEDLPKVVIDEDELKQVFLNVLNNSFDALEHCSERKIAIEGKVAGDRLRVVVRDTGKGFSNPERIFDPFFTTKSPGKATGLGLSVCYGILREHGGDIYAYNLSPNGAGVSIEIPVVATNATAAASQIAAGV